MPTNKRASELSTLVAFPGNTSQLLFYVSDLTVANINNRSKRATLALIDTRYLQDAPSDGNQYTRQNGAWATVAVTSVFGRTGAVVAAGGDYTASQITNVPAGDIAAVTVQAAIDELDTEKQPVDAGLTDIAALAVTDSNFIVGNGANWVAESGATVRTSLGLVAGGAGDIWVEKAGDIMTGDLTFNGQFHPVFNPGSDTDFIFLEGNVTGTPTVSWDESEDAIYISHNVILGEWLSIGGVAPTAPIDILQINANSIILSRTIRSSASGASRWLSDKARESGGAADVVIQGDTLGQFQFRGFDGGTYRDATQIISKVDGAPGIGDMPGRIEFLTSPDGSSSPAHVMSLRANGRVKIGPSNAPSAKLHVDQSSATGAIPVLLLDQADAAKEIINAVVAENLTNTVAVAGLFRHNTSGAAAAGFGLSVNFRLESSTTADQDTGRFLYEWATATHANRKARSKWTVYDTAEREGIRIEASGSAPMIGLYGVNAVVQAAHIADPAGGATQDAEARTAINAILVALENIGITASV